MSEAASTCNPRPTEPLRLPNKNKGDVGVTLIIIIILILLLVGAVPRWGYSRGWGYGPSGILGLILVIIVILALLGRL